MMLLMAWVSRRAFSARWNTLYSIERIAFLNYYARSKRTATTQEL